MGDRRALGNGLLAVRRRLEAVDPPGRRRARVQPRRAALHDGLRRPGLVSRQRRLQTSACLVLGAGFTAVTRGGLLDTRTAVGVPTPTPVAANSEVAHPDRRSQQGAGRQGRRDGAGPDGDPGSKNGSLVAYSDAAGQSAASSLASRGRTDDHRPGDDRGSNGRVRIRDASAGTARVSADIAGFTVLMAPASRPATCSGPSTPSPRWRAHHDADRGGTGESGQPRHRGTGQRHVGGAHRDHLDTTSDGQVTFYAPGEAVPTEPDLTFAAGRTISNTVIAPFVNGKVALAHTGTVPVRIVADLAGYFAPGADS